MPDEAFHSAADFPASTQTLVPSGTKARAQANIAAIELLTRLREAARPANPAEQRVLAAWSGWGAVPDVFDPRNDTFAGERERLRELLTREQYRQAEASILNAHYTDPAIVAVIWQALARAGFSGGRVLEPGFMRNSCVSRDVDTRPRTVCGLQVAYRHVDRFPHHSSNLPWLTASEHWVVQSCGVRVRT